VFSLSARAPTAGLISTLLLGWTDDFQTSEVFHSSSDFPGSTIRVRSINFTFSNELLASEIADTVVFSLSADVPSAGLISTLLLGWTGDFQSTAVFHSSSDFPGSTIPARSINFTFSKLIQPSENVQSQFFHGTLTFDAAVHFSATSTQLTASRGSASIPATTANSADARHSGSASSNRADGQSGGQGMGIGALIGIAAAAIAVLLCVIFAIVWRRKEKKKYSLTSEHEMPADTDGSLSAFVDNAFLSESNPVTALWDDPHLATGVEELETDDALKIFE
jgi:hypothetical protein